MSLIRNVILGATLAFGVVAVSGHAYAADAKKAEKKCDKAGKECKDGDDCKPENCKEKPKA